MTPWTIIANESDLANMAETMPLWIIGVILATSGDFMNSNNPLMAYLGYIDKHKHSCLLYIEVVPVLRCDMIIDRKNQPFDS